VGGADGRFRLRESQNDDWGVRRMDTREVTGERPSSAGEVIFNGRARLASARVRLRKAARDLRWTKLDRLRVLTRVYSESPAKCFPLPIALEHQLFFLRRVFLLLGSNFPATRFQFSCQNRFKNF
jgi:hypothetical protein